MDRYDWHTSVITRIPRPGEGKRRLVDALGEDGVLELQREMAESVVAACFAAAVATNGSVSAAVTGGSAAEAEEWLGIPAFDQGDGDLGARLERVLAAGLDQAPVAAVIGGDCPTVSDADIISAVAAAAGRGAAFVPAIDGGFCMLAVDRRVGQALAGLLSGSDWGTEHVLGQCLARFAAIGIDPVLLAARSDIDTPADLVVWDALRRARRRD